jgi:hypothetical protein
LNRFGKHREREAIARLRRAVAPIAVPQGAGAKIGTRPRKG